MSDKVWYIAIGGQQQGPFSLDELQPRFQSGELTGSTHVFTQGMANWATAAERDEFTAALSGGAAPAAPAMQAAPATQVMSAMAPASSAGAPVSSGAPLVAHEIDYEIHGEEMQFVEITLDPQEACIAEAGAFMYMDPGIEMETIFGDGSGQSGGGLMGKLLGAGKRVLTGESLFMTAFGNSSHQRQTVAFAAPYPGRIIAADLRQHGGKLLCQKDAFLCAAKGISVGVAFQRKLGVGFFGGEGFILQKLEGDGYAFVHASGTVWERSLAPGETLRLDTGCLVAFEQTVSYDIQMVKGVKSMFFGGEGLFYAAMTGPGKVWVQSLPFSRLAERIFKAAPQTGGARKGEGSILDAVGGIGNLLDGD